MLFRSHLLYNDQDDQGSLEDNNWLNDSDVSIEPNSDSNDGIEKSLPIDSVRDNFEAYCASISRRFVDELPAKAGEAVELLLSILRRTSAPLGLYEIIMKWHFFSMQKILRHQRMSDMSPAAPAVSVAYSHRLQYLLLLRWLLFDRLRLLVFDRLQWLSFQWLQ